jgi:hypothetical protein
MDELISKRAVIEIIEKARANVGHNLERSIGKSIIEILDDVGKDVDRLPPAQPDIIRCKECKHWIPYDWMFSEVWQSKNIADYPEDEIGCDCCDMAMKANDFCSRVERRTE